MSKQTDGQAKDNMPSEKQTWAFSLGDLKTWPFALVNIGALQISSPGLNDCCV